ncbi:MAG: DUF1080 domain-containing protein [Dysgonamonadaceae bacterium]
MMKFNLFILSAFLLFLSCNEDKQPVAQSLINGTDLSGWHIDVPAMDINPDTINPFIIRDGMLVTLGEPIGHIITDEEYENYRLEVEYRFPEGAGNGGVMLHSSTLRAVNDLFPQSLEVQMMHENVGDFWCFQEDITVPNMEKRRGPKEKWGSTDGTLRNIKKLVDAENPVGEWNNLVIECMGDEVKVWLNDTLVNYGYNCTSQKGKIALQSEGSKIEFKRVDITPITEITQTY